MKHLTYVLHNVPTCSFRNANIIVYLVSNFKPQTLKPSKLSKQKLILPKTQLTKTMFA